MANGSVVVHDIDSLEKFGMELAARSAELYAGEARAQLLALNDAVQYISVLAAKLRAL